MFALKANNKVIGVSHDHHRALSVTFPPLMGPQVEHIVEIDVRQQGANDASLRGPSLRVFDPTPKGWDIQSPGLKEELTSPERAGYGMKAGVCVIAT